MLGETQPRAEDKVVQRRQQGLQPAAVPSLRHAAEPAAISQQACPAAHLPWHAGPAGAPARMAPRCGPTPRGWALAAHAAGRCRRARRPRPARAAAPAPKQVGEGRAGAGVGCWRQLGRHGCLLCIFCAKECHRTIGAACPASPHSRMPKPLLCCAAGHRPSQPASRLPNLAATWVMGLKAVMTLCRACRPDALRGSPGPRPLPCRCMRVPPRLRRRRPPSSSEPLIATSSGRGEGQRRASDGLGQRAACSKSSACKPLRVQAAACPCLTLLRPEGAQQVLVL